MPHLLVATRKGLITFERAAPAEWRVHDVHFLGDRVSRTLVDPQGGARYAALDHGHFGVKLHRSLDQGASWQEITTPAYPPKPEGIIESAPGGKETPWSVQLIWAMAAGGKDDPGGLWCGTVPGGLFRSTDRGESWHLIESLWHHPDRKAWFGGGYDFPGIHSICVDPRDSGRVVVAVSCGSVWQTRDRGASWQICARGMYATYVPPDERDDQRIQDPHRVVQCRARPEVFWCQHHNGVFRSTDDCESWQDVPNVPPSTFGFVTVVHPRNPDIAWFAPVMSDERRVPVDGRLVVARTRDGGASFETLRQGLPQESAYDLIYRHCLDVDEGGEILALGSTTGNLWISEDQGDHWTAISHHLPPISSVELA